MPACARKEIVRQGAPGIFHCWNRCVRRAFLLGNDPLTGKDHNQRRQWIIDRLELLASCFVIDVGFIAILSNHLHLVLRTTPRLVKRMGDWEVARRWLRVYPGHWVLDGNWIEPSEEQVKQLAEDKDKIAVIRKRLSNVSWFMAALAEYVARRSNIQDRVSGRFFEGRFSCREITSEAALLVCGMYVDLNQIRAGEAKSPEESERCSVWYRIQAGIQWKRNSQGQAVDHWLAPLTLKETDLGDVPSATTSRASDKGMLSLSLKDYVSFLDWVGRQRTKVKQGVIPPNLAPILERLGLASDDIVNTIENFPSLFRRLAGRVEQMRERASAVGRRWLHGVRAAAKVFRDAPIPP